MISYVYFPAQIGAIHCITLSLFLCARACILLLQRGWWVIADTNSEYQMSNEGLKSRCERIHRASSHLASRGSIRAPPLLQERSMQGLLQRSIVLRGLYWRNLLTMICPWRVPGSTCRDQNRHVRKSAMMAKTDSGKFRNGEPRSRVFPTTGNSCGGTATCAFAYSERFPFAQHASKWILRSNRANPKPPSAEGISIAGPRQLIKIASRGSRFFDPRSLMLASAFLISDEIHRNAIPRVMG